MHRRSGHPRAAGKAAPGKESRTKAVFFDLGGTLLVMRRDRIFRTVLAEEGYRIGVSAVHSAYIKAESWWLSTYGVRVMTPAETADAYRDLDEKVFSALFPRESHPEAIRVSRLVRKRWPELEGEIPLELYPDVDPTLTRLKKDGYVMGLVSNAPADTGRVVEALGLSKYLDSVVISGAVGYSKPNPEIFRIALKEVDAAPGEAVHVGDLYEADIVGARNAGIAGLLIDRDSKSHGLDCPCLSDLEEVYKYLK
jgi:putative hydrolase of the HAD superfamily